MKNILRVAPRLIGQDKGYRFYLILNVCYFALNSAAYPFFAYYLKRETGLGYVPILYFTAIQHFGGFLAASVLRSRIDAIDIRIPFWVSITLNILVGIYWIFVMLGNTGLLVLCPFVFFMLGMAGSAYISANFKHLPRLTSVEDRPLGIALQTTIVGVITGLSSMALGAVLRGENGVFLTDRFAVYLGFGFVLQLLLLAGFFRLKRADAVDDLPQQFSAWLNRPFRAIASLPRMRGKR